MKFRVKSSTASPKKIVPLDFQIYTCIKKRATPKF